MTYAHVTDGQIDTIGRLPKAARRHDTGQWILGLADASQADQEATGWHAVADTPRPDDTPTTAHTRSIELVDGAPTVVWTERAKTAEEQAAEADEADLDNKRGNLRREVDTLRQWADDARSTTVTTATAVATLNVIVARLGTFFDRFADLIETQLDP